MHINASHHEHLELLHQHYKGNATSTTKYNVWTFLPKALFEQYRCVSCAGRARLPCARRWRSLDLKEKNSAAGVLQTSTSLSWQRFR